MGRAEVERQPQAQHGATRQQRTRREHVEMADVIGQIRWDEPAKHGGCARF